MRVLFASLAAVVGVVLTTPAQAATVYATSVIETIVGSGVRTPNGDTNPATTAIGAPDGSFYSPGIGGLLAVGFSQSFVGGSAVTLSEATFVCNDSGGAGCDNFPEAVDVYVGSGWVAGGADVDAALALNPGFVLIGTTFNNLVSTSDLIASGVASFDQIILVDRSVANGLVETINAGFDVDAVGVTPIPAPAALGSILLGLGMFAWIGRRARA